MGLIDSFMKTAEANASKIALITDKSQLTYEDLLQLVWVFDLQLRTRGIRPGQTVVLDSARPEFCIAMGLLLGLRSLKVVFAPLETVQSAGIAFDRVVTEAPSAMVAPERQIVIESDWFQLLGTLAPPALGAADSSAGVFVFRTSGSTGTAKFVHTPELARLQQAENPDFIDRSELASRRFFSTLAVRSGWSFNMILASLLAGGSVLALDGKVENMLPWLDLYHVDTLATTPAILQMMLTVPKVDQYLASLRDIRVGGASASPRLLADFSSLCPARLHIGYGSAEMGACFRAIYAPEKPQPIGYLGQFMRADLEIGFFDETLALLPGANQGVVGFRPRDGVFTRQYLAEQNDGQTGFVNGWFFPGDIIRRDGEDYYLIGRTKDIVNFGGNKFALGQVRESLDQAFPDAQMAAVVVMDADGLERIGVAYVSARTITEAELTAVLAPRFFGLRVARAIRLAELPMTESGKPDLRKVQSLFLHA